MNWLRVWALSLLLLEGGLFAFFSQDRVLPAIVCAFGLLGAVEILTFNADLRRRIAITAVLGFAFFVWMLLAPYERAINIGIFRFPALAHAVGQFAFAFQALQLFVRPTYGPRPIVWLKGAWGMDVWFPLYGVVVLTTGGDVIADGPGHRVFQAGVLAYAFLTLVYFSSRSPIRITQDHPLHWLKRMSGAAVIGVAVVIGFVTSTFIQTFGDQFDTFVVRVMSGTPNLAATGFGTTSQLTSINQMKNGNNTPVLHVYSDGAPGYLAGAVYERYMGNRWTSNSRRYPVPPASSPPDGVTTLRPGLPAYQLRPDAAANRRLEIWPAKSLPGVFFQPQAPALISTNAHPIYKNTHGFAAVDPGIPAAPYVVYSGLSDGIPPLDTGQRESLLQLPEELDPKVRQLAAEIFEGAGTASEKIARTVSHFHQNYTYHLGLDIPGDKDPLSYFLIERPPAHCEYFATGTVVLLRLAGVPARYVTGFVTVQRHPYGGYWVATNNDAHAWVEAYDFDRGWVIVESTPDSGVPKSESGFRMAYLWGYIVQKWREGLEAFSSGGIIEALAALGSIAVSAMLATFGAVLLIAAVYWVYQRRRSPPEKTRLDPTAASSDPFAAKMRAMLDEHDRRLRKEGIERVPTETLHAFAGRIATEASDTNVVDAAQWYRHYADLRYSRPPDEDVLNELR